MAPINFFRVRKKRKEINIENESEITRIAFIFSFPSEVREGMMTEAGAGTQEGRAVVMDCGGYSIKLGLAGSAEPHGFALHEHLIFHFRH